MTPVPEPIGDVRAQIIAALDPEHPKRAAFLVPGNDVPEWVYDRGGARVVKRDEGALITQSAILAGAFAESADDITMAAILGYPEHKAEVVKNCGGNPALAVAVQARDAAGNVITEAFASPRGLGQAVNVLGPHVLPGGGLVILSPVEAIVRRLTLRAKEPSQWPA